MSHRFHRRDALRGATLLAGAVVAGGVARADGVGADGVVVDPSAGKLIELSKRPQNYESPLSVFSTRITPTEQFYIRGHFDTPVVDVAAGGLKVGGLVEVPQALDLAALERLPQHEVEAVLQCAGNGRALMEPRVPGAQWSKGAMGNARWRGPRLKDVLALARPKAQATVLQLEGVDRPVMPTTPRFIRGVPLTKATHDDTIVALQMNGRPLPRAHGGPARLVMPGWVADGWTKWVGELTLQDHEPNGFYFEKAYRYPDRAVVPGAAVDGSWMKPMSTMVVKSIIGAPTVGSVHRPGNVKIVGVAFSGGHGVAHVDVAVGDGAWQRARITDSGGAYGFSVFEATVALGPGVHTIKSRAQDSTGGVQPATAAWNPSGYLHNAIDTVRVEVRA